jgi:hypothetical protein
VTEPTAPVLDPVEDRLRRTFAARAEDMAPGDDDGVPLDLALDTLRPAARRRWASRPLLAAAVAALVALVAAGVVLRVHGDGADDTGRLATAGEQPADPTVVTAVTAPGALVDALQQERALATSRLLGIENVITLPETDVVQARAVTDAAADAFRELVASSQEAAVYAPAVAALDDLGPLRGDVDADAAPGDLGNIDTSQEVFDRYAAMVDAILGGQAALAATIDDPTVRQGAVAYERGLRLEEQMTRLWRAAVLGAVSAWPEGVSEVSQIHVEVERGLERLVAEAAGTPYEAATVDAVAGVDDAGLLAAAGPPPDGMIDVSQLLAAVDVVEGQVWPAFLDSVEQVLAAQS